MTSRNTISQKLNRNSNLSPDSDRLITSNSNNNIPVIRKISTDRNIKSIYKITQTTSNKNNITNKTKVLIPSPMVIKIINEINNQKEVFIPTNSEFTIPANLNIPSNNVLQTQPNNSFTTTSTVLKDQYSVFSSDQFSSTSKFFNYETKPRKHKNNTIIYTSTGSYSSYKENLLITKQRAPSFLKSDDTSSEPHTAKQPKKLPRFRKEINNYLIDTNTSTSTYDNNYITKKIQISI